jgi:hypothetical protein
MTNEKKEERIEPKPEEKKIEEKKEQSIIWPFGGILGIYSGLRGMGLKGKKLWIVFLLLVFMTILTGILMAFYFK